MENVRIFLAIVLTIGVSKTAGQNCGWLVTLTERTHGPLVIELKEVSGKFSLHLILEPSEDFFDNRMVVETLSRTPRSLNGTKMAVHEACHYRGYVESIPESAAYLSYCGRKLQGLLRLEEDYIVKPYDEGTSTHIVYMAQNLGSQFKFCTEAIHLRPADFPFVGRSRVKRHSKPAATFQREEYFVETLLVADYSMVREYARDDLETYLLTIMNMVSGLFRDYSIGHAINIVLVRMIFLDTTEEKFPLTESAETILRKFCSWANDINPKDEDDPLHHDVAVLVTKHNICSRMNETCSTLGLAEVGGLCQRLRSCNINEDTGLNLAYTIAHEIGHNFGAEHDGPANGCNQEDITGVQLLMAPQIRTAPVPFIWSSCARAKITEFLEEGWGSCLTDEPKKNELSRYEEVLPPGALYDADTQCRMQYGAGAALCPGLTGAQFCRNLWCRVGNDCLSKMEAPAEGTSCGRREWCQRGNCVPVDSSTLVPIHGAWSSWSPWKPCSRTCGGGVQFSDRRCDQPKPENGGKFCVGQATRFRMCNIQDCPPETLSFRAVQCEEFDDEPTNGRLYAWMPVLSKKNPCQLVCRPEGEDFSQLKADTVADGTPCLPGTRDVCIRGQCRMVGCDWQIDSSAKEDSCGVCRGNDTHCEVYRGTFFARNVDPAGLPRYQEIVQVPTQARRIKVKNAVGSQNFLAIRNSEEDFGLTGNRSIPCSEDTGECDVFGATAFYSRGSELEEIFIPGPTEVPLVFLVFIRTTAVNVSWEFGLLSTNIPTNTIEEYEWEYAEWSACSKTCGGGFQEMKPRCIKSKGDAVSNGFCVDLEEPPVRRRACNQNLCPPQVKWWIGQWGPCSVTCGEGVRHRTVFCVQKREQSDIMEEEELFPENEEDRGADESTSEDEDEYEPLEDSACKLLGLKPHETENCPHESQEQCPLENGYAVGEWSKTCLGDPCDIQTRQVECTREIPPCIVAERPMSVRTCGGLHCGQWVTSEWSECSKTCGDGFRFRHVACDGDHCNQRSKPSIYETCLKVDCPPRSPDGSKGDFGGSGSGSGERNYSEVGDELSSGSGSGGQESDPSISTIWPTIEEDSKQGSGSGSGIRPTRFIEDKVDPSLFVLLKIPLNVELSDEPGLPEEIKGSAAVDLIEKVKSKMRKADVKTIFDVIEPPRNEDDAFVVDFEKEDELKPTFEWELGVWGKCNLPCGSGMQNRSVSCVEITTAVTVDNALCSGLLPSLERPCNTKPCEDWSVTEWTECSEICGPGTQQREVSCPVQPCDPFSRPQIERACFVQECIQWIAGPWGPCSRQCGGWQKRRVTCLDIRTEETSGACSFRSRPPRFRECGFC